MYILSSKLFSLYVSSLVPVNQEEGGKYDANFLPAKMEELVGP